MAKVKALFLTTQDVLAVIERFDGVRLATRTLAQWATAGIVVPSIAWRRVRRAPRLYSYADLGRARLVVRLTRQLGMSMQEVRDVLETLDAYETPLHELLRPVNARQARTMEAVFVAGRGRWRAVMVRAGESDLSLGGDEQHRFEFGGGDEFRIALADVVKDYRAIERLKDTAVAV